MHELALLNNLHVIVLVNNHHVEGVCIFTSNAYGDIFLVSL
jgi:hypothetical protein